jgi:hypothetical protein
MEETSACLNEDNYSGGMDKKTMYGWTLAKIRSHLKNRILVQGQGGTEVQPAGILKYSEELKRGPNTEIGPKDFFEIAST